MSVTPDRGDRKIPLDDLRATMAQITENMKSYVASLDKLAEETHLANLTAAVESMGTVFPTPPPYNPRYTTEWIAFASGNRNDLDPSALRYLCWEPNIATSDPFLAYLWRARLMLKSRPLAGLVRSCHTLWKAGPGPNRAAGVIKDLVKQYDGPSQVILKWKSNLNGVFGSNGPEALGRTLIIEKKKLSSFLEEWYLSPESPFVRQIVERACALCRDQLEGTSPANARMLFGELLPWGGWDMTALRQEIGTLILCATDGPTRNTLKKFIMMHRKLGDPRLPKNQANWAGMSQEARERFEGWLAAKPSAATPSAAPPASPVTPLHASTAKSMQRVYRPGQGWIWQRVEEAQYEAARFERSGT